MSSPEEVDLAQCSMSSRCELVFVSPHCPQIAYVEARVPIEATRVISVQFTVVSHDQGWAEYPGQTWFEARVDPHKGRAVSRAIELGGNRPANPDFFEQTWTVDSQSDTLKELWLSFLRPCDVIQLVPMAYSFGWANIVKSATIKIRYETSPTQDVDISSSAFQPGESGCLPRLHPASQNIRVLVIEPGQFAAPIDGFFEILALAEISKERSGFCALSYCWGDSREVSEITIRSNGDTNQAPTESSLHIPCTVEQAIRRLRGSKERLRIWVDSICINQSDKNEKAEQVSIMGQIYKSADIVHIWLGDSHAATKLALRIIRDIRNSFLSSRKTWKTCPAAKKGQCPCPSGEDHMLSTEQLFKLWGEGFKSRVGDIYDLHLLNMDASAKELDTLADQNLMVVTDQLYSEPWFHRVWVVQEAALARQAIVHCGNQKALWSELEHVTRALERFKEPLHGSATWRKFGRRNWILPMWQKFFGYRDDVPYFWPILELLIGAMDFKATKPCDKLFALYSFGQETSNIEDCDNDIKPNYEKTEPQVFADFTRWWIRHNKSLKIFSYIHLETNRSWRRETSRVAIQRTSREDGDTKQPTWVVPYEGRSKGSNSLLISQRWHFRATGDTIPDEHLLSIVSDPLKIYLLGYAASKIKSIRMADLGLTEVHSPPTDDFSTIPNKLRHYEKIFNLQGSINTQPSRLGRCSGDIFEWIFSFGKDNDNEVFYSASDRRSAQIVRQLEYLNHLRIHWQHEKLETLTQEQRVDFHPTFDEFSNSTTLTCLDPCYFVAENGMTGLCPWKAKEGDQITLLHGAPVPYLLRRVEGVNDKMELPTGRESAGVYELVGECYVNFIMYGEFMKSCKKKGRQPQVFTLV